MFQPLEIEKISTPTSFAPGVSRKLGATVAVEADLRVGVVVDDDQIVRARELDGSLEVPGLDDRARRVVRVVEVEHVRARGDLVRDRVEVREEAVRPPRAEGSEARRRRTAARRCRAGSRDPATARRRRGRAARARCGRRPPCRRGPARSPSPGRARRRSGRRRRRQPPRGAPPSRGWSGTGGCAASRAPRDQRVHDRLRRRQVRVADPQADHVDALALLLRELALELGEEVRRHRVEALREPHTSNSSASSTRADLLGRPGQARLAARELDQEVPAGEMDGHGALAPAVRRRGRAHGDGARAGGERLPRSPLPDADRELVRAVHADELDVCALREALVRLDERAEPQQLGASGSRRMTACGLPTETGVSSTCSPSTEIVSGSPTSTAPMSVSTSTPSRIRAATSRGPTRDPDLVRAATPREPARGNAGAVAGELSRRAVRIPDHDLGPVAVGRDHLEDPVGANAEVVVADAPDLLGRERCREPFPLHEQVVVPEPVPLRELHPARARLPRISSATSAGGRSARTGTSPGIRRIHLRW